MSPSETRKVQGESTEILIDCKDLTFKEVNSKIRDAVDKGLKVTLLNAEHLYGLAAGLQGGEITIKSSVGDYIGLLNAGAKIVIEGDAGDFIGDNSWKGEIRVKGNAGYGAGIYSYGGNLIIYGDAGDAAGQLFKGGTLIVKGNVGDVVGLYMVGGEIVVVGDAGRELGDYMIRGTIYLRGECKSLGHNTKYDKLVGEDLSRLNSLLEKYSIEAKADEFKKIVPLSKNPFG
ncbi:tributyrin esterase [Candidatus Bathyarchaeota archaeon]|nr:MAG: tributyrin esterase [Candidatus Bathyarchaeota archaeon]